MFYFIFLFPFKKINCSICVACFKLHCDEVNEWDHTLHWKKKSHAAKFDELFELEFKCVCNFNERIVYSSDNGFLPAFHRKSSTTFHVNIKHEDMKQSQTMNLDEENTNVGMSFYYS